MVKPVVFQVEDIVVILQASGECILQIAFAPGELVILKFLCSDNGYHLLKDMSSDLGFTRKKVYPIARSLRRRNLIEIRKHGPYRNIELRSLVKLVQCKCDDVPPNKG